MSNINQGQAQYIGGFISSVSANAAATIANVGSILTNGTVGANGTVLCDAILASATQQADMCAFMTTLLTGVSSTAGS